MVSGFYEYIPFKGDCSINALFHRKKTDAFNAVV